MVSLKPAEIPWYSIDLSHAALIMGVVAAIKPDQVVELGFGHGYSTDAILQGFSWNQKGKLTVVENWYDWQGREPQHAQPYKGRVEFVISNEEDFVRAAPDGKYDVLVSDADHLNSHKWFDQHLRIVRPEGILFFHDVSGEMFPNLANIIADAKAMDLPYNLFNTNSRPDENCQRGLLMVTNRRKR